MTDSRERPDLTLQQLHALAARFDKNDLVLSVAYLDAGLDPLWARFERAAMNQLSDGAATGSRYAIWANTVRDNIIEGLRAFEDGNSEKGRLHLVRAANSLSAYSELQWHLDPLRGGRPDQL